MITEREREICSKRGKAKEIARKREKEIKIDKESQKEKEREKRKEYDTQRERKIHAIVEKREKNVVQRTVFCQGSITQKDDRKRRPSVSLHEKVLFIEKNI